MGRSAVRLFQEPNLYYLTGWREPGAILLLAPKTDDSLPDEILFLPPRDPEREKYTGRRVADDDSDVQARSGFEQVLPVASFESRLEKYLERHRKIYTPASRPAADKLRSMFPFREIADATDTIGRLRLKKSPREVEIIQKSIDVTVEAHRAAWKRTAPGLFEYQAAATMVGAVLEKGCERPAYTPIVASGANATVLHYGENSRRMDSGDLLLVDFGAECSAYAADITRTIPVNGRFTPRQRELYEIVLAAQKAAIAAVKPGMTLDRDTPHSLNQIALDYINTHGKDRRGEPLGKYLTHTISHHVGLEVHDAGKLLKYGPLEPGMVITIEPGVYIPDEGIGIRIEDMVLVTDNGGRVLSQALPKEPDKIESALAK